MKPRLRRHKPWPIKNNRRRDYAATEWHSLLDLAVKHPDVWYVIEPYYDSPSAAATAAYDIRSGRNGSIPAGRWDATSRIVDDNGQLLGAAVFIKYLGEAA